MLDANDQKAVPHEKALADKLAKMKPQFMRCAPCLAVAARSAL